MARDYEIACRQCRVSLWIGQANALNDDPYAFGIYTTPVEIGLFAKFLMDHRGHELVFDEDQLLDSEEFEEIETP